MAESKRIFNAGKMNRDLDDRLVPEGQYREAMNVNIGRSEGSDVGAVENLKGNHSIGEALAADTTTIGSIRDQAEDKVYWFTTSPTLDAIHEYDQGTGTVQTLIQEQKSRTVALPTCTPDFQTRITEPTGSFGVRPELPPIPTPPLPGCTDPSAINYNPEAEVENGSCTFAPAFSVNITGGGNFAFNQDTTLTAVPTGAAGTVTYLWSTTAITQSIDVTASAGDTFTFTVTATDTFGALGLTRTATDTVTVTFAAAPQPNAPVARITPEIPPAAETLFPITLSGDTSTGGDDGQGTVFTITDYQWTVPTGITITSGQGTDTLVITTDNDTIVGSFVVELVVVNSNGDTSAMDTVTVMFTAAPPVPYTFTTSSNDIANVTETGGTTYNGLDVGDTINIDETFTITPFTGFEFTSASTINAVFDTTGGGTNTLALVGYNPGDTTARIMGSITDAGTATITWENANVVEQMFDHIRRIVSVPEGVGDYSTFAGINNFSQNGVIGPVTLRASQAARWSTSFQMNDGNSFAGGHPTITVTDTPNAVGVLQLIQTNSVQIDGTSDSINELWNYSTGNERFSSNTDRTAEWGGTVIDAGVLPHVIPGGSGWIPRSESVLLSPNANQTPLLDDLIGGETATVNVVIPENQAWSGLQIRTQVNGWRFSFSQTSGTGPVNGIVLTVDQVGNYLSRFSLQYAVQISFNTTRVRDTEGGTGSVGHFTGSYIFTGRDSVPI